MSFNLLQIIVLGLIQGAAELLPVSSSAHVIVAEKLMGKDPTSPEATFLLVMLHTGTMLAVLIYFWKSWKENYFSDSGRFWPVAKMAILATVITGVIGFGLKKLIEHRILGTDAKPGQVEELFGSLPLIASALAAAGILIVAAGLKGRESRERIEIGPTAAVWMGAVQGLALPFRGFSRSGSTISAALLLGEGRRPAEEFSFALAVILTPPVIVQELLRLKKMHATETAPHHLLHLVMPGLFGLAASFVAGLFALRLLSRWLEQGKWQYFGYYCLIAAAAVFALVAAGF
jgi:undecaprenyl-diphosphatase